MRQSAKAQHKGKDSAPPVRTAATFNIMKKYSFIGVGNMASAIIRGMESNAPTGLYDKNKAQLEKFSGERFTAFDTLSGAVEFADYIVLSVKPQNFEEVLSEIKSSGIDLSSKTFISIAAGITIDFITSRIGNVACVRTMPNTPLMIGKGVTAITRNELVDNGTFEEIKALFAGVGAVITMPESDLNPIISVTSSSPAYVYLFIKALSDGAKMQGLDYDNMTELVCKMLIGSAEMVLQSGKTPDELIRMVTSPNGTTERAMNVLYKEGFEKMLQDAMVECTKRAYELSEGK